MLASVLCNHFWLEVESRMTSVVAICKHYGCRKRKEFTKEGWDEVASAGRALNKPVRV